MTFLTKLAEPYGLACVCVSMLVESPMSCNFMTCTGWQICLLLSLVGLCCSLALLAASQISPLDLPALGPQQPGLCSCLSKHTYAGCFLTSCCKTKLVPDLRAARGHCTCSAAQAVSLRYLSLPQRRTERWWCWSLIQRQGLTGAAKNCQHMMSLLV